MHTEERLMSLLAIAEDQQHAVALMIEASQQREEKQQQAFDALMVSMSVSSGVTLLVCAMIVFTAYLYLSHIVDKTNIAETRYEELKRHNVKISSCPHGGQKYPCLRVKKSWGAYGDGTVFIIDAE